MYRREWHYAGWACTGILLWLVVAPAAGAAAEPDPLRERVQACTACHGEEKIEIAEGYVPRIRGKPAGYLYNQLMNYRAHRRHDATMNHLVRNLSAKYLFEIAEYFAAQQPPYPEPAPTPDDPALRERGQALVEHGDPDAGIPACRACHGERLTGVLPATPGLIGLPQHYLSAELNGWQLGRREAAEPDCMATIVERMSGHDIQAVSSWLAARPLPDDTRPDAEPIEATPMACGSIPRPDK
ncbi:MAG: hypothetical protein WEC99_04410 [Halofilum sp. (in: g-proteobacteria)]